jgi:hypothetical protein
MLVSESWQPTSTPPQRVDYGSHRYGGLRTEGANWCRVSPHCGHAQLTMAPSRHFGVLPFCFLFATAAGSGWCASAWRLRLFDEPSFPRREALPCHHHWLDRPLFVASIVVGKRYGVRGTITCTEYLRSTETPKPIMGTGKRGDGHHH